MKARLLIIAGIVIFSTVPFATIIILDRHDSYLEQLEYGRLTIENQPKPGERSYIEPNLKANLERVELSIREKVRQLHEGLPPSSYAVNLNHQTKEIEVMIENKQLIPKIKEMIRDIPDEFTITVEYGKISLLDDFQKLEQSTFTSNEIIELLNSSCESLVMQPEWEEITPYTKAYDKKYSSCNLPESNDRIPMCAYIGFEKYPQNMFDEFLSSPYNQDVTFLNFTDSDLKKVPLFYVLIQAANQIDYPSNDRASFPVSFDEFFEIRNYLQQRAYFEIKRGGDILENQIGTSDIYGNHRIPQILIDGKLYRVNGLNGQVFSDRDEILNVSYEWTLEESKKNFLEDDNPNRANLIYFEWDEKDAQNLKSVKDALDKLHSSDDKIRKSLDVGSVEQNIVLDFFSSENIKQFNGDESKYTRYFILNDTMYETSFAIC